MKPITIHPDAGAEIIEAVRFYESHSPRLGAALLDEIQAAFAGISEHPEAYQLIGKWVRRKPLWQFPYNMIYAVYPDRIRIVAFAHQKRHPFYWRKRLKTAI